MARSTRLQTTKPRGMAMHVGAIAMGVGIIDRGSKSKLCVCVASLKHICKGQSRDYEREYKTQMERRIAVAMLGKS